MTAQAWDVAILGIYVTDLAFMAPRQPVIGETILGGGFAMGPGGKGSNQAVAAGKAGGRVRLITRIGADPFGDHAETVWAAAGVSARAPRSADVATGAAYIFVQDGTGDNAIIVAPGAAGLIDAADVDAAAEDICAARVFMTQLEQPIPSARRGLEIARAAGVTTILNPAPAAEIDDALLALCDYVTPNETEAAALTGMPVATLDDAARAGAALIARGAGCAVLTLGANGVMIVAASGATHVPGFDVGPAVDTAGAGDAFNGGFAVALAQGADVRAAARFGCAVGALSVTRRGTAASMPTRAEIDALLAR